MKTHAHIAQRTPAWHAFRAQGVGSSDVAAVVGVSPYEDHTRASVFAEKVHGREREQTGAMYRGTILEPHARALYMERAECTAVPMCVEHDSIPWARVSLDGYCKPDVIARTAGLAHAARQRAITLAEDSGERWICELKCLGWEIHDGLLQGGALPEWIAVQVQWQLFVTGVSRCDFVSFNPGEKFSPDGFPKWKTWLGKPRSLREPAPRNWLAVVEVAADAERQTWLCEEAAAFWLEVTEARANVGKAREVGT